MHFDLYNIITLVFSTLFAGSASYIWGRAQYRKQIEQMQANTDSIEIQNLSKIKELYQQTLDDLEARYNRRISELELEMAELKKENRRILDEFQALRAKCKNCHIINES